VEKKMVRQSLRLRLFASAVLLVLTSCADMTVKPAAAPAEPPPAPREFRAAWVATVANIDWPTKPNLPVEQQQAEIIAILNRAKEINLNAIVLQVRTSADALYDSKLEPWSEYLTGEQGKAPVPFYDPLKLWVDEAHKRGIELHAWFNPYRARHTQAKSPTAKNHISNTVPSAVKTYGGFLWMDPGEAAASDQTLNVILDVVRRYNIDGVHIDDYFYPYPIAVPGTEAPPASPDDTPAPRAELPFPDEPAWQSYLATGKPNAPKLSRDDWRRENVNVLIEKIYTGIKREKAHVKFGISPFGLGKPAKRPAGIAGFSQYDKLYADAELWLQKGWLDYFTPQLYWPIDQKAQAYGVLLDYWANENTQGRHLWPGLFTSRINDTPKTWQPQEVVNQIALTREKTKAAPMVTGHVHFSMVALSQNRRGINDALTANLYQTPALVPASPWLDKVAPASPLLKGVTSTVGAKTIGLAISTSTGAGAANNEGVDKFAVWALYGNTWRFIVEPSMANAATMSLPRVSADGAALLRVVVSALDRTGNESVRTSISIDELATLK
jgi:uncharacterized lipoprotein YddW (UPF0748 family)